jgi:outer membrane protein assembly factor BamB
MFKKLTYGLLFLLILTTLTCHQKNPTSPPAKELPATMPQTDIPWPSLANSPWPMSTVNPQGIARFAGNALNEKKVQWALEIGKGKGGYGGPAIGPDGTIYLSFNGAIDETGFAAISPEGKIKWSRKVESNSCYMTGPVITADTTIYIGGTYFWALRPDGSVKWIFDMGKGFIEIRPLVGIDGTIFTKDGFGDIFALSPEGKMKWKYNTGTGTGVTCMTSSPDGNIIYAPNSDSTLIALDSATGTLLWSFLTHHRIHPCAAIDNQGNIYFFGYNQKKNAQIYSISPQGILRWTFSIDHFSGISYSGISIDYEGQLYFDARWKGIFALNYQGVLKWRTQLENLETYVPIICDQSDNLFIFNGMTTNIIPSVYCFSNMGVVQFSIEVPGWKSTILLPGAVGQNGTLYFQGNSPWLVALN